MTKETMDASIKELYTPTRIGGSYGSSAASDLGAQSVESAEQLAAQVDEEAGRTEALKEGITLRLAGAAIHTLKNTESYHSQIQLRKDSSIRENTLVAAHQIHSLALSGMKAAQNVDQIRSVLAHSQLQLQGLGSSFTRLPSDEQAFLKGSIDRYSDALAQAGSTAINNRTIDNGVSEAQAAVQPTLASLYTQYSNADTAEDRNKAVLSLRKVLASTQGMPVRTATQQKIKDNILGKYEDMLGVVTAPPYQVPANVASFNTDTFDTHFSRDTDIRGALEASFYGGDPVKIAMNADAGGAGHGKEVYTAAVQTKQLNYLMANSHNLPHDLQALNYSNSPVAKAYGEYINGFLQQGRADIVLQQLDPDLKELLIKSNTAALDSPEHATAEQAYNRRMKLDMLRYALPAASWSPLSQQIEQQVRSMDAPQAQDPEIHQRNKDLMQYMANNVFSHPSAFQPGEGPVYDASRVAPFLAQKTGEDNTRTYAYPDQALSTFTSYLPATQKYAASIANQALSTARSNKSFFGSFPQYQNVSGATEPVSDLNQLTLHVAQDQSFGVRSIAALTGNSPGVVAKAIATQVALDVNNGQDIEDALSSVKAQYADMLQQHPVLTDKTDGVSMDFNHKVLGNYGSASISDEDATKILSKVAKKTYEKLINSKSVDLNLTAKESVYGKVLGDSSLERNKARLGDGSDLTVISNGGALYVGRTNGDILGPVSPADFAIYAKPYIHQQQRQEKRRQEVLSPVNRDHSIVSFKDYLPAGDPAAIIEEVRKRRGQ